MTLETADHRDPSAVSQQIEGSLPGILFAARTQPGGPYKPRSDQDPSTRSR